VRLAAVQYALKHTYGDVLRNHTLQMAAALSYYFVLSLFPALIFLSAIVTYLPVPDLFNQALLMMSRFLPADSMVLVRRVLADVISPNKGALLSFGFLGTLWTASGGFAAAIEALNMAYEVEDDRPFWKTRPLAVGLAILTGVLVLIALFVMIVGPRFGEWLAGRVHLSGLFVMLWPYIHWSIAIGFTVMAVEAIYYLGPNVKQRFFATLPGATLAVGCWIASSYLLGAYFRHFANFNKTYGTLGAAIALMVWLYWTGFAMLLGAELNSELAKQSSKGNLETKTATAEKSTQLLAAMQHLKHPVESSDKPSQGKESPVATCEVCGNQYDKCFDVISSGTRHTFDSFECAIQALAPACEHCSCRVIGHGIEVSGRIFCCAHCAKSSEASAPVQDRVA